MLSSAWPIAIPLVPLAVILNSQGHELADLANQLGLQPPKLRALATVCAELPPPEQRDRRALQHLVKELVHFGGGGFGGRACAFLGHLARLQLRVAATDVCGKAGEILVQSGC